MCYSVVAGKVGRGENVVEIVTEMDILTLLLFLSVLVLNHHSTVFRLSSNKYLIIVINVYFQIFRILVLQIMIQTIAQQFVFLISNTLV